MDNNNHNLRFECIALASKMCKADDSNAINPLTVDETVEAAEKFFNFITKETTNVN